MFNFASSKNVTNIKSIDTVDVKVYSNNKIRIGDSAVAFLDLKNKNILIISDENNNLAIAGVDSSTEGRKLSDKGEFSHQVLSSLLKGNGSEWTIDRTNSMEHPVTKDKYYSLKQNTEEISAQESEEETDEEVEVLEELGI